MILVEKEAFMRTDIENRDGALDLAGSTDPVSPRPAACEPLLLGDLVAVIVQTPELLQPSGVFSAPDRGANFIEFRGRRRDALLTRDIGLPTVNRSHSDDAEKHQRQDCQAIETDGQNKIGNVRK